jgi:hypothetical protein
MRRFAEPRHDKKIARLFFREACMFVTEFFAAQRTLAYKIIVIMWSQAKETGNFCREGYFCDGRGAGKFRQLVEKSLKSGARNCRIAFYGCDDRETQLKGFS